MFVKILCKFFLIIYVHNFYLIKDISLQIFSFIFKVSVNRPKASKIKDKTIHLFYTFYIMIVYTYLDFHTENFFELNLKL
jgi:hypothetical protein